MTHVIADNVRELSTTAGTGNITLAGATGPQTTAVVGQAFDAVLEIGDTFDYVIHHKSFGDQWETGKGTYLGSNAFSRTWVVSSSNGGALVSFSAGEKVVWIGPNSWIRRQAWDVENIQMHNAVNGTDNAARIALARTTAGVNKPIMAPYGAADWGVITTLGNLGIDAAGQGSALTFSQGTAAAPSTKPNPIIRIEKYTNASDAGGQADHGGIDVRVKKVASTDSNNAYASYFYMEHDSDGTAGGCLYAVKATSEDAERVYGLNVYLDKSVSLTNGITKGAYFNLSDSSGQDEGWFDSYAENSFIGIELSVSSGRAQFGYLTAGSGVAGTGFYTGMLFQENSILPYSYDNNSEAIRIQGGSTAPDAYNGINFQDGYLRHAIDFNGPIYENNSTVLMPKDGKITFGTGPSDDTFLQWNASNAVNFNGAASLSISSVQVVGPRNTGWAFPSGSTSKNTFDTATVTTEQLAWRVKALMEALQTHGLIGT